MMDMSGPVGNEAYVRLMRTSCVVATCAKQRMSKRKVNLVSSTVVERNKTLKEPSSWF